MPMSLALPELKVEKHLTPPKMNNTCMLRLMVAF